MAAALGEARHCDLATKAGLAAVRTGISELKTGLKSEIARAKTKLLNWIAGATGFQTVVIPGALVLLISLAARQLPNSRASPPRYPPRTVASRMASSKAGHDPHRK